MSISWSRKEPKSTENSRRKLKSKWIRWIMRAISTSISRILTCSSSKIKILERRRNVSRLSSWNSRLNKQRMHTKAVGSRETQLWMPWRPQPLSMVWGLRAATGQKKEMNGTPMSSGWPNPKRTLLSLSWKSTSSFSFSQTSRKFVKFQCRSRRCKMTSPIFLRS